MQKKKKNENYWTYIICKLAIIAFNWKHITVVSYEVLYKSNYLINPQECHDFVMYSPLLSLIAVCWRFTTHFRCLLINVLWAFDIVQWMLKHHSATCVCANMCFVGKHNLDSIYCIIYVNYHRKYHIVLHFSMFRSFIRIRMEWKKNLVALISQ